MKCVAHLILDGARSGSWNMAIDEALLELAQKPILRFYSWEEPTYSIGLLTPWIPESKPPYSVVRRITGGGLVFHDNDFTFSLIWQMGSSMSKVALKESYLKIHQCAKKALSSIGISAELYQSLEKSSPENSCFIHPVQYDLVYNGSKVLGGAERRRKECVLYQGTFQISLTTKEKSYLMESLIEAFSDEFEWDFDRCQIKDEWLKLARELKQKKYDCWHWTQKHKAEVMTC